MSRIRTIKPGFFIDDELAELPALTRLLFIGLWTLADCKGRLEDRPKKIRAQLHPYDDGDTDAMLQSLHEGRFITRYFVDGKRYLEIRTFTQHQRLTGKEAEEESDIPAPDADSIQMRIVSQGNIGETSGKDFSFTNAQEGNGREGKGKEEEGSVSAQAPNAPTPTAMPSAIEAEPEDIPRSIPKAKAKPKERAASKTSLPADFTITPEIQAWADQHHYGDLTAHLDSFKDKAIAKGYQYADWSAAFRSAVRDDWAKLRTFPDTARNRTASKTPAPPPTNAEDAEWESILNGMKTQNTRAVIEGECYATH